jgi:ketosteroid isomerase-like protein
LNFAERWAEALVSNDAEQIGSFMSEDWVIVGENGMTNKPDFLSWISSGDLTHETMEMVGEARVKVYSDIAVLSARITNMDITKTSRSALTNGRPTYSAAGKSLVVRAKPHYAVEIIRLQKLRINKDNIIKPKPRQTKSNADLKPFA